MSEHKAKIILIRPRNIFNYYNYPPLNLVSIGSVLQMFGYNVQILDAGMCSNFDAEIVRNLDDALFVGIGILTSEVPHAIEIMRRIKKLAPDTPIVVGGWHTTLFSEQMANSDLVDYVVIGEGEQPTLKIANQLSNGKEGVGGKVQTRKYHDLENLALPDYGLVPVIEKYITNYLTDRLSAYVQRPIRWLPYDSSRGCPSQCSFCINVVTQNRRYRKKSAGKVLIESDYIINEFNLSHFKIIDDNYFVDINRVRKIAKGFIDRQQHYSVTYDCECRCDYFNSRVLNDDTLTLLRKSGLIQLTLGIESGSDHTLQIMKKGITVEQAKNAIEMCNRHGIIARSSFILETPGEQLRDIEATIRFINEMRKYPYFSCGVGTFRPYPRCELTEQLIKDGYLLEPSCLEDWLEKRNIEMYTSAELKRPWQVAPDFSAAAAHYLNIESETRIGLHQLTKIEEKEKLKLLIEIARIRNRNMDYAEGYDIEFYEKFLREFYCKKSDIDKQGQYPLTCNRSTDTET